MTSNFVFRRQNTNGNLLSFLICCQKESVCFETTLKISYFVVKEWLAVLKFLILLWKTNGRLGTVFKIWYFAVKKRMAVWVHALKINCIFFPIFYKNEKRMRALIIRGIRAPNPCHSLFSIKLKWKRTFCAFQFQLKTENWKKAFNPCNGNAIRFSVWNWNEKGLFCTFQFHFIFENRKKSIFLQFSNFNFYSKIEKQHFQSVYGKYNSKN